MRRLALTLSSLAATLAIAAAPPPLASTPATAPAAATAAAPSTATPAGADAPSGQVPLLGQITLNDAPPPTDRAEVLAKTVTTLTGVAISPLLGVSVLGAWDYFRAPASARDQLPWYAHPLVWGVGLVLVLGVAAKDAFGAAVPAGWKKPLDALETVEEKVSVLVASGAFVPVVVGTMTKILTTGQGPSATLDLPLAHAGFAAFGAFDPSILLTILALPFALAAFLVVWLLSHAITVLILISPWGMIDAALKSARTSLIGLLALTATISPGTAAILSLIVILVSALLAGWAFRWMIFGTVFSWDLFTFRALRTKASPGANAAFSGKALPGAPTRSYGRLESDDTGRLSFRWRPWLVLAPRSVPVPEGATIIGKGLIYPSLLKVDGDRRRTIALFPPRLRGEETDLARIYHTNGVEDSGVLRGLAWLRDILGFGPARPAATPPPSPA